MYLSAHNILIFNVYLADKYENMSLQWVNRNIDKYFSGMVYLSQSFSEWLMRAAQKLGPHMVQNSPSVLFDVL